MAVRRLVCCRPVWLRHSLSEHPMGPNLRTCPAHVAKVLDAAVRFGESFGVLADEGAQLAEQCMCGHLALVKPLGPFAEPGIQ